MNIDQNKDKTYFDKSGKEILIGDLLKVFHFKSRNKTYYMHHVVVMEQTKDGEVMAVASHWKNIPHCRMSVCCNNAQRVYKTAKIIGEKDWETKRKRIKIQNQ